MRPFRSPEKTGVVKSTASTSAPSSSSIRPRAISVSTHRLSICERAGTRKAWCGSIRPGFSSGAKLETTSSSACLFRVRYNEKSMVPFNPDRLLFRRETRTDFSQRLFVQREIYRNRFRLSHQPRIDEEVGRELNCLVPGGPFTERHPAVNGII